MVAEDNKTYASVDGVLFTKNKKTIYRYPDKKLGDTYQIPESVTRIDYYAFGRTKFLKQVTIPQEVTLIDNNVFNLSSVETVLFAENSNLVKIANSAFINSKLSSIVLPSKLETIDNDAFYGTQLTNIIIPASVVTINENAFNVQNIVIHVAVATKPEGWHENWASETAVIHWTTAE